MKNLPLVVGNRVTYKINGYTKTILITDKARETDIWKKENEKEKKIWEDINKKFEQDLENKE